MKYPCTMEKRGDGRFLARHQSAGLGTIEVTASTQAEALEKMKNELRYRLELCPCTGEQFQHLEVEVVTNPRV
ncbi:MAG: hypothetical protein L0Y70_25090 [Gemmataceae bacterium]|nr:hypothetical protein [Gemmataceae bacterium]